MLFKCSLCILTCECIWLILSLSVVCLFFDTLYFSFFVFFSFSNVLQVFMMYLNQRVYLFVYVFVVEVPFGFFIVLVNFSNVHWFSNKIKVSGWVERNFFSLTVFGRNLLTSEVHSSVTIDRNVQAWKWTGIISLLTWGLLWASACSLEAWDCNSVSLEKCVSSHAEWLLTGYWKVWLLRR